MLKRFLAFGAAAVSALISACDDGPATVTGTWRSPAASSAMVHASATGPVFVEIHGDPGGPLVAEAMMGHLPGRPLAFTTDSSRASHPRIRVVLVFDPAAALAPSDLCAGTVAFGAREPGRIALLAAFCDRTSVLASVQGWAKTQADPSDPRFRQLMGQTVRALFMD